MQSCRKLFRELIYVLVVATIGAYAMEAIMIPNNLTMGGTPGIVRLIQYFIDMNYSIVYYGISAIIVVMVTIVLGFKELRRIIMMSIAYPTMMLFYEAIKIPPLKIDNVFMGAIYCGAIIGVANGIMFYGGFSSGGTDSIAKIFKKKLFQHIDISTILFAIDAVILGVTAIVYGANIAMYAITIEFTMKKLTDSVMYGISSKVVRMNIITSAPDEISSFVMKEIKRGVSSISLVGEFTKECRKELIILCSPKESLKVKRMIAEKDPEAFVSVWNVNAVWGRGRGFGDIKKDEEY